MGYQDLGVDLDAPTARVPQQEARRART